MEPVIVESWRGPQVESVSRVHALWVDANGTPVKSWGNSEHLVCPRSSLKPFQALPMVLSKAYEKSPDPLRAIAISCASHSAEDAHVDFVRAWLKQLGKTEDDLVCGFEPPQGLERIRYLVETKKPLGKAFNNCSGKHTGMVATCLMRGFDPKTYFEWNHPLQIEIRQVASLLTKWDWDKAPYGIDGCGLPNYFIPMNVFARGLSAFLQPTQGPYARAMQLIRQAWTKEPEFVAGPGNLASELVKITEGRVLAKIGAQGNFMAWDFHRGRCLVLKVQDGLARAAEQSLVALLAQAGSITPDEEKRLRVFVPAEIRNWAGAVVGQITTQI